MGDWSLTMADKLNNRQTEKALDAIQTTKLVNRLQDHVLGKKETKLTTVQMRCIEILLRKTLPDVKAMAITGEDGGPILLQNLDFSGK